MILAELPPNWLRLGAVLLGLVWGSFLNVVVCRLPRGMSIVRPASHCPACGEPIGARDNIPLLSFLLLRGRARCCGAAISARYPLIEALGGVLSLAVLEALVLPLGPATPALEAMAVYLANLALALGLVAAAFIDLEHMVLPDSITLGGTALGLLTFSVRGVPLGDALLGAALGYVAVWLPFCAIYPLLRGQAGMGLGDAKLLMLAGAWLGWSGAVLVLALGAIQGSVAAALLLLARGRIDEPDSVRRERERAWAQIESLPAAERPEAERELLRDPLALPPARGWAKARIAFGPFIILATLECLLLGPGRIIHWLLTAGFG
ncbi:MAG: prepilin peptidase [Deltaproteobacteria bacterium]|nr:prepilin peptidase [Deltaproteobacteria bacterium]